MFPALSFAVLGSIQPTLQSDSNKLKCLVATTAATAKPPVLSSDCRTRALFRPVRFVFDSVLITSALAPPHSQAVSLFLLLGD